MAQWDVLTADSVKNHPLEILCFYCISQTSIPVALPTFKRTH